MNKIKETWNEIEPSKKRMIKRFTAVTIGALAGFSVYLFIGCQTGGCMITANPWISTFWGALIGFTASS